MRVVHLMASPFYGGPERQMLGLARHLPRGVESTFVTFAERGLSQALLDEVHGHGFAGITLKQNFPRLIRATREVAGVLRDVGADLVTCSGYKPDLVGWRAARQVGIPIVIVSHGWTGATWKVRLYERADRWVHRHADAVVCVSGAQADKVRRAGVAENRITTIRNAVSDDAFAPADPLYLDRLRALFTNPPRHILGAAGRLSPEKGFDVFVQAAHEVRQHRQDVGFVLFGDGPLRDALREQIRRLGMTDHFILAGFRPDVSKYLPHLDGLVLSSHTEGLPIILLEAMAAGIPVVATAVGGIPEALADGRTGYLVPPADPGRLAQRIESLLEDAGRRQAMGAAGKERARAEFTFERQSAEYLRLFERLTASAGQRALDSRLPYAPHIPAAVEQR